LFTTTATTDIVSLSLHDALPISARTWRGARAQRFRPAPPAGRADDRQDRPYLRPRRALVCARLQIQPVAGLRARAAGSGHAPQRSEEHTSELQSRENLVCRLLLE